MAGTKKRGNPRKGNAGYRGQGCKAEHQRAHASRRAMERYGIHLTDDVWRALVACITTGRSTLVERQSNRVVVHDVAYDGQRVRVVYDTERGQLVTFLPADVPPVQLRW